MAEAMKAAFKFEKFKIPNFSYNESNKPETTLNMEINPKGIYNKGVFDVELEFIARDENNPDFIVLKLKLIATFKFDEAIPLKNIPPFFYQNSIAIVFPYIRAFVSNLTLQANTGLILLGLLNLSNLQQEFIDNTIEVL
ncbi:MAG: Protein-export protein SecB [Mucilaginibacter sp.]|nr:Protein-export protein SecB [Mucilaginibacter sp.]